MLRIDQRVALALYGVLWLAVGVWLLRLGLALLVGEEALLVMAIALLLGGIKGRYVLVRVAERAIAALSVQPQKIPLTALFGVRYLLLIALMVGLGVVMRLPAFPVQLRGLVDVAVGIALLQGSVTYLRAALLHGRRCELSGD